MRCSTSARSRRSRRSDCSTHARRAGELAGSGSRGRDSDSCTPGSPRPASGGRPRRAARRSRPRSPTARARCRSRCPSSTTPAARGRSGSRRRASRRARAIAWIEIDDHRPAPRHVAMPPRVRRDHEAGLVDDGDDRRVGAAGREEAVALAAIRRAHDERGRRVPHADAREVEVAREQQLAVGGRRSPTRSPSSTPGWRRPRRARRAGRANGPSCLRATNDTQFCSESIVASACSVPRVACSG